MKNLNLGRYFILILIFSSLPAWAGTAAAAPCRDCNVVVIAIDALQAQHVRHLGYPVETTPFLDKLAARGYSFKQAVSPASWTVPVYLSLFSSLYPSEHGLTNRYEVFTKTENKISNFKKREPRITTLAQAFKQNGYRTGGFTGDSGVSAVLGYDQGFDVYTDETKFGGLQNSAEKALAWLDKEKNKKFFLFLHGYDNHGQFALPADYRGRFTKPRDEKMTAPSAEEQARLRELGLKNEFPKMPAPAAMAWRDWYDGKIADADDRVAKFIGELEKRGTLAKTLIVVLSDHGTEFFEHGRVDHGHTLYDELLRVPFIFVLPKQKTGAVIDAQVGTIDLFPTVAEMTGLKLDERVKKQWRGKSLVPAFSGKTPGRDVFSETDYRNYTHKRSLRSPDGWKYIMTLESGKEELYNWSNDPGEIKDLALTETKTLDILKEKLWTHLKALPAAKVTGTCLPVYQGQCD